MVAQAQALTEAQQELVAAHVGLPAILVRRMRTLPSHTDFDGLRSAGTLGLIEAAKAYDDSRGSFTSYATFRVRGAVLDELRRIDPMGRRGRQAYKENQKAVAELEQQLGRDAQDDDLRAAGMQRVEQVTFTNLADAYDLADTSVRGAGDEIEEHDSHAEALRHVAQLPERQRVVVEQCVLGDVPQNVMADRMGCSGTRVGQIRNEAVAVLRRLMSRDERVRAEPVVLKPRLPEPQPASEPILQVDATVVLPEPPPGSPIEQAEWAFADYWRRRGIVASTPRAEPVLVVRGFVREDWTWMGRAWHLLNGRHRLRTSARSRSPSARLLCG